MIRRCLIPNLRCNRRWCRAHRLFATSSHVLKHYSKGHTNDLSDMEFEKHYRIRSHIELLIQDYAQKPIPPVSYSYLLQYSPPLTKNDEYMLNIKTINLLLSYTCRRLNAIQRLPYIAVLNPNIEASNSLYLRTLSALLSLEYPYALHSKEIMTRLLNQFLDDHQDTLTTLAKGLEEVMEFYPKERIFNFLNEQLRDRISMKLLVTNHLALLRQTEEYSAHRHNPDIVGVLHKRLKVSTLAHQVNEFVSDLCSITYDRTVPIKILEGEDIRFACVPTHLEYVLTEVIKNSSRAHIENSTNDNDLTEKPIEITIVQADDEQLVIRVRDFGGGIAPDVEKRMFDYSYSTVEEAVNDNGSEAYMVPGEHTKNVCGMGFGLPMCRAYMELFSGSLDIQSLWGWGTDVYIKVRGPPKHLLS